MKVIAGIVSLCLTVFNVVAQRPAEYHRVIETVIKMDDSVHVELKQPVSSFSIEYLAGKNITSVRVIVSPLERYSLHQCRDCAAGRTAMSNLIIFKKPVYRFNLLSTNDIGKVKLHLLYAQPVKIKKSNSQSKTGYNCNEPEMIDQDRWRVGLPDPKGVPESAGKVQHIIVHHTDTPNSDSDYVNVVRNIYLYHTQSNGWDDIGYNYLVAADGSIFAGRDGRGQIPDDNTKGAHFCNKNSNTMGIAMIGTFDSIAPADTAIRSLRHLAVWKLVKEGLMSTDSYKHPVDSQDAIDLKVLAGHRDGCATDCPGGKLYALLPSLRKDVDTLEKECDFVAGLPQAVYQLPFSVYPQPAADYVVIKGLSGGGFYGYQISSVTGQDVRKGIIARNEPQQIDLSGLNKGVYILSIQQGNTSARKLILKD